MNRVRFHPGSTQENYCLFHAINVINLSVKTTGSYSVKIVLSTASSNFVGANCKCKAGSSR